LQKSEKPKCQKIRDPEKCYSIYEYLLKKLSQSTMHQKKEKLIISWSDLKDYGNNTQGMELIFIMIYEPKNNIEMMIRYLEK
jgi:hypothetical protein